MRRGKSTGGKNKGTGEAEVKSCSIFCATLSNNNSNNINYRMPTLLPYMIICFCISSKELYFEKDTIPMLQTYKPRLL